MTTPAEQLVLIDAKLADYEPINVNLPAEKSPNANRIATIIEISTRLIGQPKLRKPQLRRLSRFRELLNRVA